MSALRSAWKSILAILATLVAIYPAPAAAGEKPSRWQKSFDSTFYRLGIEAANIDTDWLSFLKLDGQDIHAVSRDGYYYRFDHEFRELEKIEIRRWLPNWTLEHRGGVRAGFLSGDNLVLLYAAKNEAAHCYFMGLFSMRLSDAREAHADAGRPYLGRECINADDIALEASGGAFLLREGQLYMAIGTPVGHSDDVSMLAQAPGSIFGKILRTPLVSVTGARDASPLRSDMQKVSFGDLDFEVFCLGVRNVQAITEAFGRVLAVDHGPQGGDRLLDLQAGANYGWPVHSYGRHYGSGGKPFGELVNRFAEPLLFFIPSVAPATLAPCPNNLVFYQPCLIVGSLKGEALHIVRLGRDVLQGNGHGSLRVLAVENLALGFRVRKLEVDGEAIFGSSDSRFLFKGRFEKRW